MTEASKYRLEITVLYNKGYQVYAVQADTLGILFCVFGVRIETTA